MRAPRGRHSRAMHSDAHLMRQALLGLMALFALIALLVAAVDALPAA